MQDQNKVPFDPGFFNFSANIPEEALLVLDEITTIKQPHRRKFEFQKFEMQLIPAIKNCVAIYLGCILWGSFLSNRYKSDPKEISGNVIMEMPEDKRKDIDYNGEIDIIIELINKLDKSSLYYLKKPSRVDKQLISYLESYKEFCQLNNNFVELDRTDMIKLPETVCHFANYDDQKLDELKAKIEEIISSAKIENILEIGFYQA